MSVDQKGKRRLHHTCVDFIITNLMVSTMQSKYEQETKVNQQQVNINVNERCFTIIVVHKSM